MNRAVHTALVTLSLVTLSLLGLTLTAAPAAAWTPISGSQPVWPGVVNYSLHQAGLADLPFATIETEVRRGMEDWTAVSCTGLTVNYEGTTSTTPRGGDGNFTIGWIESGWGHSSSAIGVTGSRFTSGTIVEADMEMNGVNFTWTTNPGSGSNVNVYSIALHEGGHWHGLGHSSTGSAAMYFAYSGGISVLGPDDEAGICALYPGGGGGATDCTTTGCPTGQECVGGSCRPTGGTGSGGETCTACNRHEDCGGSSDYCLGYPDGSGYCGEACATDADCGGDRCLLLEGGLRQCVRYAGDTASCAGGGTAPGCTSDSDCASGMRCGAGGECVPEVSGGGALGEACAAHDDCASGSCFSGQCAQSCDWPSGACPSGYYCDGEATGACGPGVCMAGAQGAGAVGDSCDGDTECDSLYCHRGRCAEPCVPGQIGACDGGAVCTVGDLSCRGGCGVAGSLGDPCDGNPECSSGLCASRDGHGFCTALCDASSPCGPGFTCSNEGSVAVCVPDGNPLGASCDDNADCASSICAHEASRNYCTRLCDSSAPCATQMACVESGTAGFNVCQPLTNEGNGRPDAVSGCSVSRGSARPGAGFGLASVALLGLLALRRRP